MYKIGPWLAKPQVHTYYPFLKECNWFDSNVMLNSDFNLNPFLLQKRLEKR